jgi:hypothetical protein
MKMFHIVGLTSKFYCTAMFFKPLAHRQVCAQDNDYGHAERVRNQPFLLTFAFDVFHRFNWLLYNKNICCFF